MPELLVTRVHRDAHHNLRRKRLRWLLGRRFLPILSLRRRIMYEDARNLNSMGKLSIISLRAHFWAECTLVDPGRCMLAAAS